MELKRCPFCGGEVYSDWSRKNDFFVTCDNCNAYVKYFETEQEAIDAWNRRT
jgi:Lar family restriction alleviation protein